MKNEDYISLREAAKMLGASIAGIKNWIREGKINGLKQDGEWIVLRAAVEAKIEQSRQEARNTTMKVGLIRQVNGRTVPKGFDLIKTYEELSDYTTRFAEGIWGFMLLVGSPGCGKSRQMQYDLRNRPHEWIDNHVSNVGLYMRVYFAYNKPVIMDDINHFLKDKRAVSLMKSLTQTEGRKQVSWESPTSILEENEVPKNYVTSSPICMIANMWDAKDMDQLAVQDRAVKVAFFPSPETIHERVGQLGWCDKDVFDFVGQHLDKIEEPSMREYFHGMNFKKGRMDWRRKLQGMWGLV